MRLEDVALRLRTGDTALRNPCPVLLVVKVVSSDDESGIHTPAPGSLRRGHDEFSRTRQSSQDTRSVSEAARAAVRAIGDAQVLLVQKSDRNPFDSMITVGRAANNDIAFDSPLVSKLHAYFRHDPRGWLLTDQHSTNGTFVGEEKVAPGEAVIVPDGSVLSFGRDVQARFFTPSGFEAFVRTYATTDVPGG